MTQKIYFNQKPLVLTDSQNSVASLFAKPDTAVWSHPNDVSIEDIIQKMQSGNVDAGVFLHSNVERLLETFKASMKLIKAAGGFIYSDTETILLIFRRGKWDLPKGKVEQGESLDEAAMREVIEETGLQQLQIEDLLTITYHTYYEKNELILKESHWYLMNSSQQQSLVPQTEEDIEACVWAKLSDLATYSTNMHASIIDVIQKGREKLNAAKKI